MITLTEKAANHIQNFLTKRGKGEGIRLGVKTSGCSGMAYTLEFVSLARVCARGKRKRVSAPCGRAAYAPPEYVFA